MAKKKRKVVKEEIDDFSKKTVTRKSGKKVITSKFKLDGKNIRSKQVRDAKGNVIKEKIGTNIGSRLRKATKNESKYSKKKNK